MSYPLFANLAGGTLASGITNSATSLTLTAGQGALFPSPGTNQFFPLTLQDQSNPATVEIVYCTARSGDVLTVVRGREGTTGLAFNAGDYAQNRPTAATLEMLNARFAIDSGSANALAVSVVPAPTSMADLVGVPIYIQKSAAANTGAVTINVNSLGATTAAFADGTALTDGEWPASAIASVMYNGTSFEIVTLPAPGLLKAAIAAIFSTINDVTGSRVVGTTYTNNTGRPMMVLAVGFSVTTAANLILNINGSPVFEFGQVANAAATSVVGIVPAGASYSVTTTSSSVTVNKWVEIY